MTSTKILNLFSYCCGVGANNPGCADGPPAVHASHLLNNVLVPNWHVLWHEFTTVADSPADKYDTIAAACRQLATGVAASVVQQQQFIVLGGDQSGSIATWSGTVQGQPAQGELGLIWIDAHMDAHTPATSETGNIHGMPLAALLGYGDARLTSVLSAQPKLKPENICLIGVRSFEKSEEQLLKNLKVRVIPATEVKQYGIQAVLQQALQLVTQHTTRFGISIDLDGIDPTDAPGVGCPVPNGINGAELIQALQLSMVNYRSQLEGIEIVEYNPHHDEQQKTLHLIGDLVRAIFIGNP